MDRYHYTAGGLPNVWIMNMKVEIDDEGERVFHIPNLRSLHRVIAESIVFRAAGMSGSELRFLRSEMGLTQAELGDILHKEGLTVGRWERGEHPIDANAETVIRLLAVERLKLACKPVADVAAGSVHSAREYPINIDGGDPKAYRMAA